MGLYQSVYLLGISVWFAVWLLIYFLRPDLRREMLIMSFGVSWLGVTQFLYVSQYWTPQYLFPIPHTSIGLEDFLITFMYGCLAGVGYEFAMEKRLLCSPHEPLMRRLRTVVVLALPGVACFFVLQLTTTLNIIYTSTLGLLIIGAAYAWKRPRLAPTILFNGLCLGTFAFLVLVGLAFLYPGVIAFVWNLDALSGILLWGVPIEEFFFHFAVGCAFALMYEIQCNCRVVRQSARGRFRFSLF